MHRRGVSGGLDQLEEILFRQELERRALFAWLLGAPKLVTLRLSLGEFYERQWDVEHQVIALMSPPLNSAGNAAHPFFTRIRDARAALRAAAEAG